METARRGSSSKRPGRSILLALVLAWLTGVAAQQPAELVIRNGLVVTAVGRTEGDLRIRNGSIVEIGRNLTAAAGAQVIDAKGMLVLPGGIDPHVHVTPTRTATTLKGADDYTSASRAALAGGKTTISNFINLAANNDLRPTLAQATELVKKQAIAAAVAYLVRKHAVPGFEMFGRIALNFSTGGINVAAVEHFSQIKGGWGRIVEMPTRDSCGSGPPNMNPQNLAQNRPWMLLVPPGSPQCIATAKNGELLPEVKYLIGVLAKIRTVDSNGRLVLATGHATGEEHLLLAREGRKQGLQVLLTHPPADAPQVAEAAQLGAYIEMNASGIYKTVAGSKAAAERVKKIGAEHIIVGTDCGQTVNVYPTDCLVLAARGMRAHGVTQRELDLMYKVNPAKLLGLPPLEEIGVTPPATATRQ